MKRVCPIGYSDCQTCNYREELNDCGYQEDNYETALQQAAKRALIDIERPIGQVRQVIPFQQYTGLQSVLNGYLGVFHSMGFRLMEKGGLVILYYQDEPAVFVFHEHFTVAHIHTACFAYLLRKQVGEV